MGLRAYIIRRILLIIPTLIGVTLLIFAVIQLFSPVDRVSLYVRSAQELKEASSVDELIAKYHLNDPIVYQYYYWITQLLQGNLGISKAANNVPVLEAITSSLPATIELVLYSAPITILLGIQLGVISAVHRDKIVDHATRFLSIVGWSLPTFWLGIVLISIFYGGLGWLPPRRLDIGLENSVIRSSQFINYSGLYTIDSLLNGRFDIFLESLRHLILPVITLTTIQIALLIRIMRSSMLETLGKGYVTTARAKGLSSKEVINKHAKRNALIPAVTLSGILIAGMLTGVVITETIFDFKGIGYYAAHAATQLDIPGVLGFALFTGIVFTIANLIVDILYAYIDPRIRLG